MTTTKPSAAQLSAGKLRGRGRSVWHQTWDRKRYWTGSLHDRTPRELLKECRTVIADLLENHPELK